MRNRGLRRSYDSVIGGVCGGIAEFYDLEPEKVRLGFGVLALFGGSGLLAYTILYFVMPPPY